MRATDSKKKISTQLSAKDYPRFQTSYENLQKVHMDALKARAKKAKKKPEKAAA